MYKRKTLFWVLILVVFMMLLAGCKGIKDREALAVAEVPEVTLKFYYPRDGSGVIQKLVAAYQREGVILEAEEIPGNREEYLERIAAIQAAEEPMPDVMLIHDSWLAQFAHGGYLQALDGGFSKNKQSEYFAGWMEAVSWNGKVYGIPFWQDVPLLYYRSDLIDTPPMTWEALEQSAVHLAQVHEMPYGLVFPGNSQENASSFFASLLAAYQASPDYSAREAFSEETSLSEALHRLHRLVLQGVLSKDVLRMNAEDSRISFEKGNAVYMWNWSYATRVFAQEQSLLYGRVGIVPIPLGRPEMGQTSVLSGWAVVMGRQTKAIPEVWSFMEYITGHEAQHRIAAEGGLVPARRALFAEMGRDDRTRWIPPLIGELLEVSRPMHLGTDPGKHLKTMSETVSIAISKERDASALLAYIQQGMIVEPPVDEEEELLNLLNEE